MDEKHRNKSPVSLTFTSVSFILSLLSVSLGLASGE